MTTPQRPAHDLDDDTEPPLSPDFPKIGNRDTTIGQTKDVDEPANKDDVAPPDREPPIQPEETKSWPEPPG